MKCVPRKGFGSADTLYTLSICPSAHNQLIRTLFEAHVLFYLFIILHQLKSIQFISLRKEVSTNNSCVVQPGS